MMNLFQTKPSEWTYATAIPVVSFIYQAKELGKHLQCTTEPRIVAYCA
jgi:hypothetical protein